MRVRIPAALKQPARRAAAREAGMSLVEVLVSISLIAIVMSSAGLFFANSLRSGTDRAQRQEAVFLANRWLESVEAMKPADLLTGRSSSSVTALLATPGASALTSQDWTSSGNFDPSATGSSTPNVPTSQTTVVNNVTYTMRTFINLCSLQSGGSCTPGSSEPSGDAKLYRVTVDASWIPPKNSGCASGGCDYSVSTLIDPHADPKFNTNISHPQISSLSPSTVGSGAVVTMTITGSTFVNGATVSIDTGGGTFVVTGNTGTQITGTFTAGSPGTYTLAVTNPDGGRATVSLVITPAPQITAINPVKVNGGGTTTAVTLSGLNFQTGATITSSLGTVSGVSITGSTSASFNVTEPGASGGTDTITLTNPDFGSDSITLAVVSAPNVTSISPGAVTTGTTTTLTFSGVGFLTGAAVAPTVGTVNSVTVSSSTTATVSYTAPAVGPTSVTFRWTNTDGGVDNTTPAVSINPAPVSITSVGPAAGLPVSTTGTVTISGSGFVAAGSSLSVSTGTINSYTVGGGGTTITVNYTAPSAPAVNITFTFHNADGGVATNSTFDVNAKPTLTNLCAGTLTSNCSGTQSFAHNTNNVKFTVFGTGFQAGSTVTLTLSGSTINGTALTVGGGGTRIQGTLASKSWNVTGAQTITVVVTNPDGGTVSQSYSVNMT